MKSRKRENRIFAISSKGGFVYLLIILAVLAVSVFLLTVGNLNDSFRQQVNHVAHKDVAFEMAYSVLSGIMARIYTNPWSDRFFAAGPVSVMNKSILDSKYDFLVEDSPGRDHQFDAYIRIDLLGKKRLFFWRVGYHDNILEVSRHFSKIFFTTIDENKFPSGSGNRISDEVDKILENREKNREKAELTSKVLKGSNNSKDIAELINAPTPKFPDNDFPDFNPISPKAPEIVSIPGVAPPPAEEKPKIPAVNTPPSSNNPSVEKEKIDQLIQQLRLNESGMGSANNNAVSESGDINMGSMNYANNSLKSGLNNADLILQEAQTIISEFAELSPGPAALLEKAKVAQSYIDKGTEIFESLIAKNNETMTKIASAIAAIDTSNMSEEESAAHAALVAQYEALKAENDRIMQEGMDKINKSIEAYQSYLQSLQQQYPTDPAWQEFTQK